MDQTGFKKRKLRLRKGNSIKVGNQTIKLNVKQKIQFLNSHVKLRDKRKPKGIYNKKNINQSDYLNQIRQQLSQFQTPYQQPIGTNQQVLNDQIKLLSEQQKQFFKQQDKLNQQINYIGDQRQQDREQPQQLPSVFDEQNTARQRVDNTLSDLQEQNVYNQSLFDKQMRETVIYPIPGINVTPDYRKMEQYQQQIEDQLRQQKQLVDDIQNQRSIFDDFQERNIQNQRSVFDDFQDRNVQNREIGMQTDPAMQYDTPQQWIERQQEIIVKRGQIPKYSSDANEQQLAELADLWISSNSKIIQESINRVLSGKLKNMTEQKGYFGQFTAIRELVFDKKIRDSLTPLQKIVLAYRIAKFLNFEELKDLGQKVINPPEFNKLTKFGDDNAKPVQSGVNKRQNDDQMDEFDGLNTNQIDDIMNKFIKKGNGEYIYLGCFGFDQKELIDSILKYRRDLLNNDDLNLCWVMNTEYIQQNGQHWISCVLDNNTMHIFDSQKCDPEEIQFAKKIIDLIDSNYLIKLKYNSNKIQGNNNACALYAMNFIMKMVSSDNNFEESSMRNYSQEEGNDQLESVFFGDH